MFERVKDLTAANKLVEAQRLEQRTRFDLEMIQELARGYCSGLIENYSNDICQDVVLWLASPRQRCSIISRTMRF